jgi:hypothetical protein
MRLARLGVNTTTGKRRRPPNRARAQCTVKRSGRLLASSTRARRGTQIPVHALR